MTGDLWTVKKGAIVKRNGKTYGPTTPIREGDDMPLSALLALADAGVVKPLIVPEKLRAKKENKKVEGSAE